MAENDEKTLNDANLEAFIKARLENIGDIRESYYWRQDVDDSLSKTDPRTISWQELHDRAHCL